MMCGRCGREVHGHDARTVSFLPSVRVVLCPQCWHDAYDFVRGVGGPSAGVGERGTKGEMNGAVGGGEGL